MRADARENLDRILAAAARLFAQDGADTSLKAIALEADVGIATLYRRFPTRRDLIAEVFAGQMTEYVELAERALREPDPWKAFVGYLFRLFELQAADRGLSELLASTGFDDDERLSELRAADQRGASEVIARAQRAGALRADFSRRDLALLMRANAGVVRASLEPDSWKRQLELLLTGLASR